MKPKNKNMRKKIRRELKTREGCYVKLKSRERNILREVGSPVSYVTILRIICTASKERDPLQWFDGVSVQEVITGLKRPGDDANFVRYISTQIKRMLNKGLIKIVRSPHPKKFFYDLDYTGIYRCYQEFLGADGMILDSTLLESDNAVENFVEILTGCLRGIKEEKKSIYDLFRRMTVVAIKKALSSEVSD